MNSSLPTASVQTSDTRAEQIQIGSFHPPVRILMGPGPSVVNPRVSAAHALAAGIEAMGLQFVVKKSARLPQLNTVTFPAGINEAEVPRRLLRDYSLAIGSGLGSLAGKVWRIGCANKLR